MSLLRAYDNENIFDFTIRAYGNVNGLSGVIDQVTDLDSALSGEYNTPTIIFADYIPPTQPETKLKPITHIVREDQSIYDLAVQLSGTMKGMASIISNYTNLDSDLKGQTLTIERKKDPQLDYFLSKEYVFATRSANRCIVNSNGKVLINSNGKKLVNP